MLAQGAFQEAERQYRWYTDEYHGGRLDLAGYRNAINNLRVTDAQGRLWTLQEGSGQWHVWTGSQWEPAMPYRPVAPAAPPPPTPAQAVSYGPTPPASAAPAATASGCLGKVLLYWLGALVLFALIGGALMLFVEDFPIEGLGGVGLAALISMIITAVSLSKSWEGEIVELYQKRVRVSDEDGDYHENVLYARIRQPSGRLREERAMPDWRVGTYLRKQRGQMHVEKLN